jgi:hypothetical protein
MQSQVFAVGIDPLLAAVCLLQVLGLLIAAGARFTEGTSKEALGQWLCLAGLGMMGGLCGVALCLGPGIAVMTTISLTLMTMIAVVDLGRPGSPSR